MRSCSVIIPARNEEAWLPACLASVRAAAAAYRGEVETIVVVNRCTDRTERIARAAGATVVHDESRNLAAIRNAGARAAHGEMLCTVDADSRMSPNTLHAAAEALLRHRCVGGGVPVLPERWSLGIAVTGLLIGAYLAVTRTTAGLFWCRRADFHAIGGFDERLVSAEDLDFATRLRRHGARRGRRLATLWNAPLRTSCRKFDHFGDWYLLTHPVTTWRLLHGRDQRRAATFYYDVDR